MTTDTPEPRVRDLTEEPSAESQLITRPVRDLPTDSQREIAQEAVRTLPPISKAQIAQEAVRSLPLASKEEIANEVIQDLPVVAKKDVALAAAETLPEDAKQLVQQSAGNPSQMVNDKIWLTITYAFATVLVLATVMVFVAIYLESSDIQTALTVFTTVAGILAGFISGRASAGGPSR